MIIFLYGPDDFRREERKKYYIREFQKKHTMLGVEQFDCARKEVLLQLGEFLRAQSLFGNAKLAYLEHIFETPPQKLIAVLKNYVASGPHITILISESVSLPSSLGFLKRAPVRVETFEKLKGSALHAFIEKKAKEFGISLESAAAAIFSRAYEDDTWAIVTELQKLSFLGKTRLRAKDLAHLTLEIAPDFWELAGGFQSTHIAMRLQALQAMFAYGEPAAKIFHVLAYQRTEKLAKFARCDLAVKSGKMDYEEALLDLVL